MEWAFRIATDPRFGGGHGARCFALAVALGQRSLLFRDPGGEAPQWAGDVIEESGAGSAGKAIAWLGDGKRRALVIDSYAIKNGEIEHALDRGFVAAFRDGGAYGPEHVSIDVNPGAESQPGLLAGPGYFPLPARFGRLREEAFGRDRQQVERVCILVAFGQRDSDNNTMLAINAIGGIEADFTATVVLGMGYSHADDLSRVVGDDRRFSIVKAAADLAALYGDCDLAIGAPGVSQFERACCGLPAILVPQDPRQAPLAAAWALTGAAIAVPADSVRVADICKDLIVSVEARARMRAKAFEVVDDLGARRLADALEQRAAAS